MSENYVIMTQALVLFHMMSPANGLHHLQMPCSKDRHLLIFFYIVAKIIVILCELVPSTSDQLVDHQQKPLTVISGL